MRFFSRLKKTAEKSSPTSTQQSDEKDGNFGARDSSSLNFDNEKDPNVGLHHPQPLEYEQEDAGYQTENDESYSGDEDDDEFAELPSANSSRVRQARILDALEMMADDIYRYGSDWRQWFVPPTAENYLENVNTGVAIRSKTGNQVLYPYECPGLEEFGRAVTELNTAVSLSMMDIDCDCILMVNCVPGRFESQFAHH
jgi:hypothetical protein